MSLLLSAVACVFDLSVETILLKLGGMNGILLLEMIHLVLCVMRQMKRGRSEMVRKQFVLYTRKFVDLHEQTEQDPQALLNS